MPASIAAPVSLDCEFGHSLPAHRTRRRAGPDRPGGRLRRRRPANAQIRRSLEVLAGGGPHRAEQVQMVFSEEGPGARD